MYRTPKGFNNPKGLSDEKAARMMTALRGGHTLRFFAVKDRRLEAYFAKHPEYAREARPLIEANAKAAKLRKGSRRRSQTHCKYGHPLSGDNLRIFNLRRGVGRGCRACMKRNGETGRKFSEDQARRTVAALQEGQTISDITKSGGAFYIANHRALLLFRQKQPKFDTLVLRLSAKNADVHRKDAGLKRRLIKPVGLVSARPLDIFATIRAAVPNFLPRDAREEIIASMALAIVEGRLRPRDISERVKEFTTAHYRMFSKFGPVSLDTKLFDEGSQTLGDTITRGLWD